MRQAAAVLKIKSVNGVASETGHCRLFGSSSICKISGRTDKCIFTSILLNKKYVNEQNVMTNAGEC
jgi:hypothetical protein